MSESKEVKRVLKDSVEVYTDLFKLEVAIMKRNVSFEKNQEILVPVEHCHFFHSFDSSGRKMNDCVAICGHKHPMKLSSKKVNGEEILTAECMPSPDVTDQHTHKCTYIHSELVKARKLNTEAAKYIGEYDKPVYDKGTNSRDV